MSASRDQHGAFDAAYSYFNKRLFGGQLPACMITMQRKNQARGYFWGQQFRSRQDGSEYLDEIAINPESMKDRTDREILSTLVHEMCHLWQHHFGNPSRGNYHNRQWADLMISVGLIPSDTGEPGGKQVGQSMTHYVEEGGPFAVSYETYAKRHPYGIDWHVDPAPYKHPAGGGEGVDPAEPGEGTDKTRKAKRASKTKYTCQKCGLNIWAKPGVTVACMEAHEGETDDPWERIMLPDED